MPTWKLTIEYQGTRYHGWQEQKNARTVAGLIRQAAEDFFGSRVELGGAGRTDSGVHALAQVAHLRAERHLAACQILRGLNNRLPADINILKVEEAQPRFDARRDALSRYYLYQISMRRTAFAKNFVWWVKDELDLEPMREAARLLVRRGDFAQFCQMRGDERSTIVEVECAQIGADGDLILFRIGASHFLWKMVRRIVGMLVQVGLGRVSVEEFRGLLSGPVPHIHVAAHTAPPSGLFLEKVIYDEGERVGQLRAAFPVRAWPF